MFNVHIRLALPGLRSATRIFQIYSSGSNEKQRRLPVVNAYPFSGPGKPSCPPTPVVWPGQIATNEARQVSPLSAFPKQTPWRETHSSPRVSRCGVLWHTQIFNIFANISAAVHFNVRHLFVLLVCRWVASMRVTWFPVHRLAPWQCCQESPFRNRKD